MYFLFLFFLLVNKCVCVCISAGKCTRCVKSFFLFFKSGDGNWYRALVQNVTSDGIVKVCFMDYGNVEEVPVDKIRQIPSSFLQLPFQGIKCWLSGGSF